MNSCSWAVRHQLLYVGETGRRLEDRFREHRLDVQDNKPEREVAAHFNQPGHVGINDMKVLGLSFSPDVKFRKLKEQKIIAKLGCYLGGGMNIDFNFPQLIEDM